MPSVEVEPRRIEGTQFPAIRTKLEELLAKGKYVEIGNTEGIKIVKRDRSRDTDCFSWALGLKGREMVIKGMQVHEYPEAENPQPGDFVLYFSQRPVATHIGILKETGRVVSKWSEGYVYEHPPFLVPRSYGDRIKVVRG
jgi:hypothetical protein